MFENAFGKFLLGDATFTPVIVSVRVFPLTLPQNPVYPAICYERLNSTREPTQAGSSGLVSALFSIDCYAATYKDAKKLAEAVRLDLDGFSGNMGQAPDVTQVNGAFLESEADGYNDELNCYVVHLTFTIEYQEATSRS